MNNLRFLLLLSLSFFIINTAEAHSPKITLDIGKYFIYVKSSNQVLNVVASNEENSAEFVAYQFTGNPNQTFRVWVDAKKSYCSFTPQHAKSKRLTQSLTKKNTVIQYEAQKKSNYRFQLTDRGGGYYSIKSLKNVDDKIDEVFTIINGKLKTAKYTGASSQLFKFKKAPTSKSQTNKPSQTSTKSISSSQHPVSSVDALLDYTGHNGKVYFFKGDKYWRFNFKTKKVDTGYPAKIITGWKGLKNYPGKADFSKNLDAVVNRDNKHCYFFKGAYYIKWDIKNNKILPSYPAKISTGWKGLPSNFTTNIDAAYSRYDGKVYFFKGSNYVRYTVNTNKVDSGYPKESNPAFKLGNDFGNPKAAMRIYGQSAMYFWDNTGKYFKYNVTTNKKFSSSYPALISNKAWNFGQLETAKPGAKPAVKPKRPNIKSGALYNIIVKSNGQCIDVASSSDKDFAPIVSYGATNNANQIFKVWVNSETNHCTFKPEHVSYKRLSESRKYPNTIVQYDNQKNSQCQFFLTNRGGGYYSIQSRYSYDKQRKHVWTIINGKLKTAEYTGGSNQLFKFKKLETVDYLYTVSMVCKHSAESDRSVEIYGNLSLGTSINQNVTLFSRNSSSTQKLNTDEAKVIKKGLIKIPKGSTFSFSGALNDEDDSPNPDDPLGSANNIELGLGRTTINFNESDGDTKVEVLLHVRKDEIQEYEKGNAFSGFKSMINKFDNSRDNKPEEFEVDGTSSNHMFTHYSAGVEHCQGVTKAGKNYVISHDTRKGRTEGLLVICKPNGDAVFHTFGKSNHPGAIQACGDIVIVPMSNEGKTYFIDVSNPDNPITLNITLPSGGGAAGLVYHQAEKVHYALVGSGAYSADRLYKSNGESITSPKCRFTLVSSTNIRARQGMANLVYDPTNSCIYMIAMERNVDDNARETLIIDKIVVGTTPSFNNVNQIGFSSYPGNTWNYAESSRWGAGLVDLGNGNFELIAIARLLTGGPAANYVQMQRWKLP